MRVLVDRGYRTALGISFYDRVGEYERLKELLGIYRTVVVYGPRGVGKSEFARYLVKRENMTAIVVDARAKRVESIMPRGELASLVKRVVDLAARLVAGETGALLVETIPGLFDEVRALLRGRGGKKSLVVIDEFHQLPGYRGNVAEAIRDLEAVAALLAKSGENNLGNLLIVVSEGFMVKGEVMRRLRGYSATFMLVEHMDWAHFKALHEEYARLKGCKLNAKEVYALVGGTPGYLPELCNMDREHLVNHVIPDWLLALEQSLSFARGKLYLEPHEVIDKAYKLLTNPVQPLRDPLLYELGELLTEANIVYPRFTRNAIEYRPQLPVYTVALEIATQEGRDSLLGIPPEVVYQRSLEVVEETTKE